MAKFYGQTIGCASTVATRRGSAKSGIKSTVQSWEGSVITELNENEDGKNNFTSISLKRIFFLRKINFYWNN